MIKADLHVHSIYSEHPSEWFLQKLGAGESYTDPEVIYRTAKERGMSFVTITDHNRIDGSLLMHESHPEDTFTGLEATVSFPEDGHKVHLLVYGLSEAEYAAIQRLRKDIYSVRDYLKERDLAHSLAHATFAVNSQVTMEHLEKLILLFDVFEARNGGRSRMHNDIWTETLRRLTPARIEDLYRKHRIEPYGSEPWVKGFTGGSDDHAGMFMGRTYTKVSHGGSAAEFLEGIKGKGSEAGGRHNDYQSLAFTVYKVAYDFSRAKGNGEDQSAWQQVTEMLFERKKLSRENRFKLRLWRSFGRRRPRGPRGQLLELVDRLQRSGDLSIDDKVDVVYAQLSNLSDTFVSTLAETAEHDLLRGDVVSLVRKISSAIPGVFISVPFLTTLRHMYSGKDLLGDLEKRFADGTPQRSQKILWFADTLDDTNGESRSLKKLGWLAHVDGKEVRIVTSLEDETSIEGMPVHTLSIPPAYQFAPMGESGYVLKIPSILRPLQELYDFEPDAIYISTYGPVGLLGLMVAKLLSTKSIGIRDPDFDRQFMEIVGEDAVSHLVDGYTRWFYSVMDEVRTPGARHADILQGRSPADAGAAWRDRMLVPGTSEGAS